MATFYRIIVFFYIIIMANSNVLGDGGNCNEVFNQCTYEVLCQGSFQLGYINYYLINDPTCKVIVSGVDGNGYRNNFFPVHLTYKKHLLIENLVSEDDLVPSTNDINGLNLVTRLDLSNNNYEAIPNLQRMENLDLLKICQNSLTVAKLSNINELPVLTEINYSHNTISGIQYESDQQIFKKLKKIDLSYNYLTKITDAVFDPFHELESLDVSHNFIDTLGPFTFEGMKKLLYMNISFNRISDINSSFFRFKELKQLDLSNNRIKDIKSPDFKQLTNLETLDLNSNFISVLEIDVFHNMPLLKNLYLNNNKLEYLDKETFNNTTQLAEINISGNNFKSLTKSLFKNKNINYFYIRDNNLEGSVVKGTFDGLSFVTDLDLSNQHITSVDDYAFNGLNSIQVLLLNGNNIRLLSPKSFRTIKTLISLDLSFNKIEKIEFEKDDLSNLVSLILRSNHLTVVKQEDFLGLHFLQYLDLSDNKITAVEANSFKSLKELINFQISNNPLNGTLQENTFDGLNSLPKLDISCTLLSNIRNGSFSGMVQLKKLNVSHSKINSLEYNTFIHTGAIESIDLSFNKLKEFYINSTELVRLNTLYVNNNLLKIIDAATFQKMSILECLYLSYNEIQTLDTNAFTNMKQLRLLDISYNTNLILTPLLLSKSKNVDVLNLSGIKTGVSFVNIKDVLLSQLIFTNSSILDVKMLHLNELQHLEKLNLFNNDISKLETGGFYNMSVLKNLDLSYNKISYIQPGVFRDNVLLQTLNISHNLLTDISYGIFRGPIYLQNLDISYNNIKDLQNERFYEVSSLSVLIADHNKIESINSEEFQGTRLSQLSIGDNPIPCDILVNLKRHGASFLITAIRLDFDNDENVDGVTCNKKPHALDRIVNGETSITHDNGKVLLSIRDILIDHFSSHPTTKSINNFDEKYMINITDVIKKITSDLNNINNNISTFVNQSVLVAVKNNETNTILDKILKLLRSNSATTVPPIQITKDNATYDNLVLYINRVKQELEQAMKIDKNSRLDEIEAKVLEVNSRINRILLTTEMPRHEKLTASTDSKSVFTEICIVLILVILVGFVLYKVYKSRIYVRQRLSISTRELPDAMDSTL